MVERIGGLIMGLPTVGGEAVGIGEGLDSLEGCGGVRRIVGGCGRNSGMKRIVIGSTLRFS